MDNWIIWEILAEQKVRELRSGRSAPRGDPRPRRPGLRRRLASLLVTTGVRLDAEAGRAVLSPVRNHS